MDLGKGISRNAVRGVLRRGDDAELEQLSQIIRMFCESPDGVMRPFTSESRQMIVWLLMTAMGLCRHGELRRSTLGCVLRIVVPYIDILDLLCDVTEADESINIAYSAAIDWAIGCRNSDPEELANRLGELSEEDFRISLHFLANDIGTVPPWIEDPYVTMMIVTRLGECDILSKDLLMAVLATNLKNSYSTNCGDLACGILAERSCPGFYAGIL